MKNLKKAKSMAMGFLAIGVGCTLLLGISLIEAVYGNV